MIQENNDLERKDDKDDRKILKKRRGKGEA